MGGQNVPKCIKATKYKKKLYSTEEKYWTVHGRTDRKHPLCFSRAPGKLTTVVVIVIMINVTRINVTMINVIVITIISIMINQIIINILVINISPIPTKKKQNYQNVTSVTIFTSQRQTLDMVLHNYPWAVDLTSQSQVGQGLAQRMDGVDWVGKTENSLRQPMTPSVLLSLSSTEVCP